ncbi:MAG: hypothetical protein AAFZ52_09940 [Bacteroidota bacterium]
MKAIQKPRLPTDERWTVSPAIRADIVLGMPKHDCRFHGICRIEPLGTTGPTAIDRVTAWLVLPALDRCLFVILRNQLSEARESYHFSQEYLELHACQSLRDIGGPAFAGKVLQSGRYPLCATPDHYYLLVGIINP